MYRREGPVCQWLPLKIYEHILVGKEDTAQSLGTECVLWAKHQEILPHLTFQATLEVRNTQIYNTIHNTTLIHNTTNTTHTEREFY